MSTQFPRTRKGLGLIIALTVGIAGQLAQANDSEGRWSEVIDWNIVAIHVVLTPQGKLLSFGSTSDGQQSGYFEYSIWDPSLGTGEEAFKLLPNTTQTDVFCAAQVLLPGTGEVLMSGGDQPGVSNVSNDKTTIFDGVTEEMVDLEIPMNYPRWYPTTITLPNGEVLIQGGSDIGQTGAPMITPEIFTPGQGWRSLLGATSEFAWGGNGFKYWYPRAWVMPNGIVFGYSEDAMFFVDYRGDGRTLAAGTFDGANRGRASSAVMYTPGRILQVGGGSGRNGSAAASVITARNGEVNVRDIAPMAYKRQWHNTTLLPDGSVLVNGGSARDNELGGEGPSLVTERWDPQSEGWTALASEQVPRLYHSSSILLPDGRVLSSGGGLPGPLLNYNAQLFEPPYLFDGDEPAARPSYTLASNVIGYGEVLEVEYESERPIARVTLIKTGAVTHSFNNDQRFLELPFQDQDGTLRTITPRRPSIATPGFYLLFLIDDAGTPSVASIVQLPPAA